MEVALDHHRRLSTSEDRSSSGSEVDSDVEEVPEARLKARKPRHQYSGTGVVVSGVPKVENNEGGENNVYLNKYGGAIEDLNIKEILNTVPQDANQNVEREIETKTKTTINGGAEGTKPKSEQIEEIMEEEVVELEFEKAIPKLHTHTMHCPNCDSHITKVVLRRKIIRLQPPVTVEPHKPRELLGCLSCFSLFTSSDNGGFNPFPIFGSRPTSSTDARADGNENCLSIFRVFRREKDPKQPDQPANIDQGTEQPQSPAKVGRDLRQPKVPGKVDPPLPPSNEHIYVSNKLPVKHGEDHGPYVEGPRKPKNELPVSSVPSQDVKLPEESTIDIPPETSTGVQVPPQPSARQDSTSFEILKSIVYGGLMEVIASLSIVASAAAGEATTLNIVALALANLIGGVFVLGHNLWDLKDDCYKFSNQESLTKYKELLGSVEHFPLHAFFAILSFLVFGIIPPVAYGYAFHETNDRDYTMVIVAVASFVCVALLAIFKAYIDRCTTFSGYVKTITYYLTTSVAVSGVSYAVGNLASRLIEELGLFDTGSNVATTVFPGVVSTNPSLAYY